MIHLCGKSICGGMASGTVYRPEQRTGGATAGDHAADTAKESERLEQAILAAKEDTALCAAKAESETAREIFEVHGMMLEDEDVLDFLRNSVKNDGKTAEEAVSLTENYFSQMFRETQDDYMIARIDDIRDVCGSLNGFLSEREFSRKPEGPFVLVADELLPSTLIGLKCDGLIGIVTATGSPYSHVSILIKEMGIPAIICDGANMSETGMSVLLDADGGEVFFDPDREAEERFGRKMACRDDRAISSPLGKLSCKIYVNIGNPNEVSLELMEKCDGIGLFRTEYMYLGRSSLPSEEEQLSVYRDILEKANGKPVTVRTFDIGSDKSAIALPLEKEENPALGLRGLRVYSIYPEVFRTQLRALLRAAVYGELMIMYPMITSRRETEDIKNTVLQVAKELEEQGAEYRIPLQGAMIETPAAALLSGELAEEVDFFSVGTNDLAQYTYALDRQASGLASFCDEGCEAVLALMRIAADNAHKNGIKIGICGELASNSDFAEKWSLLGMDYISVSPSALPDRRD